MTEDAISVDRTSLAKIGHGDGVRFALPTPDNVERPQIICRRIVRCLPGKRLAFVANWGETTVFVKLFFDGKRGRAHYQREQEGIEALHTRGILAPALLYSRAQDQGGFYFLVFEYIDDSVNFASYWDSHKSQRLALLRNMAILLAKHHASGLIQDDLHLNNFLIKDKSIYTLDGDRIKCAEKPLDEKTSFKNIAKLLAQFEPSTDAYAATFLADYICEREWMFAAGDPRELLEIVDRERCRRRDHYLHKTLRECGAFVSRKSWRRYIVFDRHYQGSELERLLADPDQAMAMGVSLKTGNTSTVVKVAVDGRQLAVKRYNIKNVFHGLRRAFRRSRAEHSWLSAHRLRFYDIATPKPIALVEERWGPIRRKAYYICLYSDGVDALSYFSSRSDEPSAVTEKVAWVRELVEKLARAKISHGDMKATNILLTGEEALLVDLDAVTQPKSHKRFEKRRKQDAERLLKNWQNYPAIQRIFIKSLAAHHRS